MNEKQRGSAALESAQLGKMSIVGTSDEPASSNRCGLWPRHSFDVDFLSDSIFGK
jgi:hypothetical protein